MADLPSTASSPTRHAGGGVFTVAEVIKQSDGTFTETADVYQWDAAHQSSPRQGWRYGVKMRTHREDYPGADNPTEQILGPNYTPFTLSGVWDDRYNFPDFAETTRIAFEKLVQRGNYVRIEFEGISITGLITDLEIDYKRRYYISYNFTFSPHFRNPSGDVRQSAAIAPDSIKDPQSLADEAAQLALDARQIHQNMPAWLVALDTIGNIAASIDTIIDRTNTAQKILTNRVLAINPKTQSVNAYSRLVQQFVTMSQAAKDLKRQLGQVSSTDALDYETANATLEFEIWQRDLAYVARKLIVLAKEAADALARVVTPRTLALYRPYSGESLYGISIRFFGTADRWRDIYEANNMQSLALNGTELLIIPDSR